MTRMKANSTAGDHRRWPHFEGRHVESFSPAEKEKRVSNGVASYPRSLSSMA